MKQLPNGAYQNKASVIHRLDATIKILLLIILLAAVISADTIIGYILLIVFSAAAIAISKTDLKTALGNIIRMIWFFVLIFLMNLCFFKSDNAWFSLWIFHPSYDGLMQGIKVVVRVAVFLIFCNILNASTPPVEITKAIENIMYPLSFIKLPTRQLALIISVSIQFIPVLSEEADMIKKVQTSRGAGFDSRRLRDKAAAVMPMAVPIFISAFRRADELSLAMEARGYRLDSVKAKRGRVRFTIAEIVSLILSTALCAVQIIWF